MADLPREQMPSTPLKDRLVQAFAIAIGGRPDSRYQEVWFGPGPAMTPSHQETAGRAFDYPFGVNLNFIPRGESGQQGISFYQLRGLADGYDLLRLAIETRKDQVQSYDWEISPLDPKVDPSAMTEDLRAATEFLERPDHEHDWDTWLRMAMEELLVIDALAVYPRATLGGDLYALELVDGATIKRLIDDTGRTPMPPDAAYQQILKGTPASNYTRDELLYWMRNPRVSRIYGLSPTEQVIITVNIAIRRQLHQLNFYTEGNVPEALIGVPDTWSGEQLKQFQLWWDSVMEGNLAQRRHMKFIPRTEGAIFPKADVIKDAYDEWLARIICYCFSISPNALVHQVNRAQAQQVADTAKEEGLTPWLTWIATQMTFILKNYMGLGHLKFGWKLKEITNAEVRAQVHGIYIDRQVLTPDEAREEIGRRPMTAEQRALAFPAVDPLTGLPIPAGATLPGEPSPAILAAFQEAAGGAAAGAADSTDRLAAAFRAAKGRVAYPPAIVKVDVRPPDIHLGDVIVRAMPAESPDVYVTVNGEPRPASAEPRRTVRRVVGHRRADGALEAEITEVTK